MSNMNDKSKTQSTNVYLSIRSLPAFNSYMNPVVESVQEILDKFLDTLDKMDQQYNN